MTPEELRERQRREENRAYWTAYFRELYRLSADSVNGLMDPDCPGTRYASERAWDR